MNQYMQQPFYPQPDLTRQRLAQMETQYVPQYQQPMPRAATPYSPIMSVPVASEQEAMAVPTDFTGALQVMVDQAHGMIYTKQLSPQTGAAVFGRYALQPETPPVQERIPAGTQNEAAPVTREEFQRLRKDFDDLFEMITKPDKGGTV